MKKYSSLSFIIVSIIAGGILYTLLLKTPATKLYCQRQIDHRLYNFRQAIRKNSSQTDWEENTDIESFLGTIYRRCLENN